MQKYIDIPWCSNGYFDEDTQVDLIVHTTNNSFGIYNVTTDVSVGEDWLTCEVGHEHPRRGIYVPAKDIVYIEIVPSPPYPSDKSEYTYTDLFGDDDAAA